MFWGICLYAQASEIVIGSPDSGYNYLSISALRATAAQGLVRRTERSEPGA